MSAKRRSKAPSTMGKHLGPTTSNDPGLKKRSVSRVSSSNSQSDAKQKNKKKKAELKELEEENQDFPRDEQGKLKNVIWDKDMLDLSAVKTIFKVRNNLPPPQRSKAPRTATFIVKKGQRKLKKTLTVGVAIPAPKDITSHPLLPPIRRGPKLDVHGRIVAHSILGEVEDFIHEADKKGQHYQTSNVTFSSTIDKHPKCQPSECGPLQYWNHVLADRERQKAVIIDQTQRDPNTVLMGETTAADMAVNQFTISGRRGLSVTGFWKQPTLLGTETNGIREGLTKSDKGRRQGIEYIGVPAIIRQEKGYIPKKRYSKSGQIVVHSPQILHLFITGHSAMFDPEMNRESENRTTPESSKTPTLTESEGPPFFVNPKESKVSRVYPSLSFGGHKLTWSDDVREGVAVRAEVGMETVMGQTVDGTIELINTGVHLVGYDWKKMFYTDTFKLKREAVQRFYLDSSYGMIQPGERKYIRAIFKSPNPGVYSQNWLFETHPKMCGGADIVLTLWGISRDVDVNKDARQELERSINQRGAASISRSILYELLRNLGSSHLQDDQRRSSYQWIFEDAPRADDHFNTINTGFYYHSDVMTSLLDLSPDLQSGAESDASSDDMDSVEILHLGTLKKTLENMPDNCADKDKLLWTFHKSVSKLLYPVCRPVLEEKLLIGRGLWRLAIDNLVSTSLRLRSTLGVSSERNISNLIMDKIKNLSKDLKGRRKIQLSTEKSAKNEVKGHKKSQTIKPSELAAVKTGNIEKTKHDPLLYSKYREKLYYEVYQSLGDMVDRLQDYLSYLTVPSTTLVKSPCTRNNN